MSMVERTKRLISEINRIHLQFSADYFETHVLEKVNLSRTLANVPTAYIYKYRLYLHESINDYLATADLADVRYFYRVKTRESIEYKILRYAENPDQFPVNNWLNDIFGARILLDAENIAVILELLDGWHGTVDQFGEQFAQRFRERFNAKTKQIVQLISRQFQEEYGLKNWYIRNKEAYRGIHVYFKNKSNFFYPWELQIWDEQDVAGNIQSHRKVKREFLKDCPGQRNQ
jgi:hypothetical protein